MSRRKPDAGARIDDEFEDEFDDDGGRGEEFLKRLLLELLGRWYWPALGLILGVGLAGYYLAKTPKRYASTATMLVKQNTTSLMKQDEVEEIDLASDEGLNTVTAQLSRMELLEDVWRREEVRELPDLMPPPVSYVPAWLEGFFGPEDAGESERATSSPEVVGSMLRSRLSVSVRRGTRLVDVTVEHEDPATAKVLADAVVYQYLDEVAVSNRQDRDSRSETLVDQAEDARSELQDAMSALAIYKRALEIHDQLEAKEDEVFELKRRYRSKHPKMMAAESQLDEIRGSFLSEFRAAAASPADREYWRSTFEELEKTGEDPRTELDTARRLLLARTEVLKGETESRMSVFNAVLVSLEEAKINREDEPLPAELSSGARLPENPSSPRRLLVFGAGGMGGLFAGTAFAFLLIRLDNRFSNVAQLEQLAGLPVFVAVPLFNAKEMARAERRAEAERAKSGDAAGLPVFVPMPLSNSEKTERGERRARAYESESADTSEWAKELVFRPGLESSLLAESYRVLRASINLLGDEKQRKVTLFTSALPGEGKTITSANHAMAVEHQGKNVLLIDLDLRKPKAHRVFGFHRKDLGPGITNLLAGQVGLDEAAIRVPGVRNLDAIFAGGRAPNPAELLDSERLRAILEEAREKYDHIVIDSAPLLAVPDTRLLLSAADNVCLVVRADYVPKGAVIRVLEVFREAASKPSGLVFNAYKESRRMMGQNYSYGSYRMSRYGKAYRYGYGAYGAYGSDKDDD